MTQKIYIYTGVAGVQTLRATWNATWRKTLLNATAIFCAKECIGLRISSSSEENCRRLRFDQIRRLCTTNRQICRQRQENCKVLQSAKWNGKVQCVCWKGNNFNLCVWTLYRLVQCHHRHALIILILILLLVASDHLQLEGVNGLVQTRTRFFHKCRWTLQVHQTGSSDYVKPLSKWMTQPKPRQTCRLAGDMVMKPSRASKKKTTRQPCCKDLQSIRRKHTMPGLGALRLRRRKMRFSFGNRNSHHWKVCTLMARIEESKETKSKQ